MCKIWIIFLFCIALYLHTCDGSAWLQDPPSRSAAWYYMIKTPVNYNFRNLDCGGVPVKIKRGGNRNCGLCGDPYTDRTPRENEVGGKYANPRVRSRYYESGQVAEISIWNNLPGAPGFYEFRLCDEDSNQTQACLDKHLLTIEDTGTTYMPVPKTQGLVMVHVQLPAGVTCDYCLLQWRFRKESLAGCDDQNWCGVGRGAQIEYYNCADIMIGSVGQPKPSYIQDPIYSAADYGSAYDVATTRTDKPGGSNLVGSTTTQTPGTTTTKGVPIVTIPTVFPATSGTTTNNPVTTSGTTINPVITNAPTTTQGAQTTTPPRSRLVVDSNGNTISRQTTFGGSDSNVNNKYLLVLLSLLPLFGAIGLQNSRTAGPVPPLPVPPGAPVTWARAFPIYPAQFDNTYGFGNFISGNPAYTATGTYGSDSGYHAGYSIFNAGKKNNLGVGNTNRFPINQNTKIYANNNINTQWNQAFNYNENLLNKNTGFLNNGVNFNNGGGQFVQNPVVWNNNGVTLNNRFTRQVLPRSTSFQNGTPYQPNPIQYAKPSVTKQSPPPSNEYGNNHQAGYAPHNNIVPPKPRMQVRANGEWPNSQGQRIAGWQNTGLGQGTRIRQNNRANTVNNNWQNNGGLGSRNSIMINAAGTGQRVPVPETVTQRMRIITPAVTQPDNSFNLPGIESAARFKVNSPRQVIETSQPMKHSIGTARRVNGGLIQNGGGKLSSALTRSSIRQNILGNNDSRGKKTSGSFLVNDWYSMLLKRFPVQATRAL